MKNARAAIRYAKAILNLAKDSNADAKIDSDMKLIVSTISENNELDTVLNSPVINSVEKINVLNALFINKVDAITLRFFSLLQENKRIPMLGSIAKQYSVLYNLDNNIQVAKVTTAVPLSKEIEQKVLDKIVALTGAKANLENEINPAILGGFILRVGDVQYDASISNYLNELKKEFNKRQYV